MQEVLGRSLQRDKLFGIIPLYRQLQVLGKYEDAINSESEEPVLE